MVPAGFQAAYALAEWLGAGRSLQSNKRSDQWSAVFRRRHSSTSALSRIGFNQPSVAGGKDQRVAFIFLLILFRLTETYVP